MRGKTVPAIRLVVFAITGFGLLTGCGSSANTTAPPPPAISVSVVPATVSVQTGLTEGFIATVLNDATNRGVTWSIGNPTCTAALCGTIDATGKYTAPAAVPNPPIAIQIVATSIADSSKQASGVVTVVPSPISVTVTPGGVNMEIGHSQKFIATVLNDPLNKGVTWSISQYPGNTCGPANDCGTIDATGNYTAGQPSSGSDSDDAITIIATSVADPTKSGGASVLVYLTPSVIIISPDNATIRNSGTQQFNVLVRPMFGDPVVTWSVSGPGCERASCGTIDSNGRFTAPASAPNPPSVTVTSTSNSVSSVSGSATVFLGANPNNSKLAGQYAFLLQGLFAGDTELSMVGSVTADGNGNISGLADINVDSSIGLSTNVPVTGTYSIGTDNRGVITLTPSSPVFVEEIGTSSVTFSLALGSFTAGVAARGKFIESDDLESSGGVSGVIAKQDPSAFSTAAITGGYAFSFSVPTDTCNEGFAIGRFTANGGVLTSGQTDVGLGGCGTPNAAYTPNLAFGGTYTVSPSGRGVAAFTFPGQNPGFTNFGFFVVSASELFVIEEEPCPRNDPYFCSDLGHMVGVALQQSPGQFSTASLSGSTVLTLTDNSVAKNLGVTLAAFDGSGAVNGTTDAADGNGGVIPNLPVGGTYSVDANGLGRGVLTFSGDLSPKPFYLVSPGKAFSFDSNRGQIGTFDPQSGAPVGNNLISGTYILDIGSTFVTDFVSPGTGVATADGAGNVAGTADAPDGNGNGLGQTFTGVYSITANGRGTLTTGGSMNWVCYVVSPSKVLLRGALSVTMQK